MKFEDLFSTMKFVDSTERLIFNGMFVSYTSDLPANFYLNQFELSSKYTGTSFEDWTKFLQHQPFDSWKTKQVNLIASTETNKALSGNLRDKDSVTLLKARNEIIDSDTEVKPTIIVMPESLFFKKED